MERLSVGFEIRPYHSQSSNPGTHLGLLHRRHHACWRCRPRDHAHNIEDSLPQSRLVNLSGGSLFYSSDVHLSNRSHGRSHVGKSKLIYNQPVMLHRQKKKKISPPMLQFIILSENRSASKIKKKKREAGKLE